MKCVSVQNVEIVIQCELNRCSYTFPPKIHRWAQNISVQFDGLFISETQASSYELDIRGSVHHNTILIK